MKPRTLAAALATTVVIATPSTAFASKRDDARTAIAAAEAKINLNEKNGITGDAATIQAQARDALKAAQREFDDSDEDAAIDIARQADALAERASAAQKAQVAAQARLRTDDAVAAVVAQDRAADAQNAVAEAQAQKDQALAEADRAKAEAARAQNQLAEMQMKQTALGATLVLQDVVFESGKADLKPGADAKLRPLAEYLQANGDVKVRIDGHTDAQGADAMNQQLSQARAGAVRTALTTMGVDAGRIEAVGHGESVPVADNKTAAGRQQNRRVEITLIGQQVGTTPAGS